MKKAIETGLNIAMIMSFFWLWAKAEEWYNGNKIEN